MSDGPFLQNPANTTTGRTTVVITTHNYGRYLAWCIQSVLAQTLRPAQIVVVDDASEDNTEVVCAQFLPQIEYYRVEYRNAQKSRNFGLAKASSEYVIFLDADDFMSDSMIERLESALNDHPCARVAYCDKYVFGDPAAILKLKLPYYWKAADFSVRHLQFKNFIMLTSLVRREFISNFDERIRRLQDWDTWLGILKSDEHAIRVPQPLLHYRAHGDNLSIRRKELIERLKVMAKHGLIHIQQLGAGNTPAQTIPRHQEIVVYAMTPELTEVAPWHDLSKTLGCRVRAIVAEPCQSNPLSEPQDTIIRDRNVIVQAVSCPSLDDLFWRFTGVASNPEVAAVVRVSDVRDLRNGGLFRQTTVPVFRSELDLDGLLNASSLEELGTFSLSPAAIRLLLYLPPAARQTIGSRLRHRASRLWSEHISWRFGG